MLPIYPINFEVKVLFIEYLLFFVKLEVHVR